MRGSGMKVFWLVSFFLAACVEVMPLYEVIAWVRPEALLLVVIAFGFHVRNRHLLLVAVMAGLALDVLNGDGLGLNAFSFVLASFLLLGNFQKERSQDLFQQVLLVVQLSFVVLAVQFWGGVSERPYTDILIFFLPALISGLMWPFFRLMLRVV